MYKRATRSVLGRKTVEAKKPTGILNPAAGGEKFRLSRHAPSADLVPFVERYWVVEWDLRGREPYPQETLPHPCVNLVVDGGGSSGVFGVVAKGRFSYELSGRGRVFGVKFRPGGFYPFWKEPVSGLTDRSVALADAFGAAGAALESTVLAEAGDEGEILAAEDFLRRRMPERDGTSEEIGRLVDRVATDRSLLRLKDLVALSGRSRRTLQRLFEKYVGASPGWVVRRYRLQEAAELLATDGQANLADLALALGYFDQAHFTKDFRTLVGVTPAEYAKLQREDPQGGRTSLQSGSPWPTTKS